MFLGWRLGGSLVKLSFLFYSISFLCILVHWILRAQLRPRSDGKWAQWGLNRKCESFKNRKLRLRRKNSYASMDKRTGQHLAR
jgi:hypothetical protein